MFPGDMQAIMAKILFFIFAFIMLCLSRAHTAHAQYSTVQVQQQVQAAQQLR